MTFFFDTFFLCELVPGGAKGGVEVTGGGGELVVPDEPPDDDEPVPVPVPVPVVPVPVPVVPVPVPVVPVPVVPVPVPVPVAGGAAGGSIGVRYDSGAAKGTAPDAAAPYEAMIVCVPLMIS